MATPTVGVKGLISLLVATVLLINVFEEFQVHSVTGFFHPRRLLPPATHNSSVKCNSHYQKKSPDNKNANALSNNINSQVHRSKTHNSRLVCNHTWHWGGLLCTENSLTHHSTRWHTTDRQTTCLQLCLHPQWISHIKTLASDLVS